LYKKDGYKKEREEMERRQFEHLINESGLHLDGTFSHLLRFMVSWHVEDQFSTDFMNDTLFFGRDEFESMTIEQAQFHIDACIQRLDRAAHTKSHEILYPEDKKQSQPKTPVIAPMMAINYPAH
jgi:hypothetical protein